jgi:hypothetical protein
VTFDVTLTNSSKRTCRFFRMRGARYEHPASNANDSDAPCYSWEPAARHLWLSGDTEHWTVVWYQDCVGGRSPNGATTGISSGDWRYNFTVCFGGSCNSDNPGDLAHEGCCNVTAGDQEAVLASAVVTLNNDPPCPGIRCLPTPSPSASSSKDPSASPSP